MAKKNPVLYSVSKTFFWFFVMSMLLLGSLVAIVATDYKREWKVWQKKFIQLKLDKAKSDLAAAETSIDQAKLAELTQGAADAKKAFASHRGEYDNLLKEIQKLDSAAIKARTQYQTLKQYQDSYKYYFEEYREHHDRRSGGYERRLSEITPKVTAKKIELEGLEKQKEEKEKQAETLLAAEKSLKKDTDKLLLDKTLVQNRIAKIKPTLAKDILNAPMVDFVAPTLKVQQIVLDNLYDDYHFAKTQKVDRCTTCHLGIDQKGFEDAPQPFRTHPKLDLYLGSSSSHPIEKFGCTTCHGGSGHSISFKDSAHTPRDENQAVEWKKKYGWHELEKWDQKMLPMNHVEAACVKCHSGVVAVPGADKLNQGRRLAEVNGCFNCHKIAGYENRWKVGPDLTHIQSKVTEDWISKWVDDPSRFRPSTKMPQVFHLSNTSSPEDRARNNAAIESISAYLIKNSSAVALTKPPVPGDAARGEKLIKDLGCIGCHTAAGVPGGEYAPELSNLGSKTTPEWLYTWLKNPKHFSPTTRMPSLRLNDQEASDIARYLISQRNSEFEAAGVPKADPAVVNQMILDLLQGTMRQTEAQAQLDAMSPEEKMDFLGKKSIAHQGCFGCHVIKGFEAAKPIGADLSNEGRKDLHQFDFGFVHLDHTRQAWIGQKLKDPRIFDEGKMKPYYDKLRMPQFHFTDEQISALTTFVLSLSEEKMPLEMQRRLSVDDVITEEGRLLVDKFNCTGCHTLDGRTGVLRTLTEDQGSAPPILDGEGAKVQEEWLHEFLKAPTPIRPWLTYRMPTFDFSREELRTLVSMFDHLSGQHITYEGIQVPETDAETLAAGKGLFDTLQCVKCHQVSQDSAAMGTSFLAPDLTLAKDRLKPEWTHRWILDPQAIEPGTMMPTFFADGQSPLPDVLGGDAEAQIDAIKDYLYRYETDSTEKKT